MQKIQDGQEKIDQDKEKNMVEQQMKDLEDNTILSHQDLKACPGLVRRATAVRKRLKKYEEAGVEYEMLRTFLLAPELEAKDLDPEVLERVATLFPPELVKKETVRRWRKDDKDRKIFITTDAVVNNLGGFYLDQGILEMVDNGSLPFYYVLHPDKRFERASDTWKKRFLKQFAPQTWKKLMEHQQYIDFARGMPSCLAAEELTRWRDEVRAVQWDLMTMEVSKMDNSDVSGSFTEVKNKWNRNAKIKLARARQSGKNTR